jgi:fructokinase
MSDALGCIEAGGTKFVCGVVAGGEAPQNVMRIETTSPDETLRRVSDYFRSRQAAGDRLSAFGIASFGPVEVDPASPRWGSILQTPKPGWSHVALASAVARTFGAPVGFDTDVNAAALAEAAHEDVAGHDLTYVTVGTGIGGGSVVNGAPLHGARHPEMGHIHPPRHPLDHAFQGCCPFHGACLEGLASGPAIEARWGRTLSELPAEHEAHEIIAWYLAHLTVTIAAVLAPHRIVLGGGVMQAPALLDRVKHHADGLGGDYFGGPLSECLGAPRTGDNPGLRGAAILARRALESSTTAQTRIASG